MKKGIVLVVIAVGLLFTCAPWLTYSQTYYGPVPLVPKTLVSDSTAKPLGAYCLDGSLPAYHLDRGHGSGARNWILHIEGGGWCNDVDSCVERTVTRRGSSHFMDNYTNFTGILSNYSNQNPEFYNWNRVRLRYCDGGSFAGDSIFDNGTTKLHFKGQKIWQAMLSDILQKGLAQADKALLSGSSAGGLATFIHCDNFASLLPKTTTVKCLSDAGFFVDLVDIANRTTARSYYHDLIVLQGILPSLNKKCTSSMDNPELCLFPQYVLNYIQTPYFILNAAYDTYQFHMHFISTADPRGKWKSCKLNTTTCTEDEIHTLHGLRQQMLDALDPFYKNSKTGGTFINSCFAHGQSEYPDAWYEANVSPRMYNTTIAQAVGNWYFERKETKLIDCPYPCDKTCHNLI